MADLGKMIESFNAKLSDEKKIQLPNTEKSIGRKRRAWLEEDKETSKEVYRPLIQKGPINLVDESFSSTPLINPVHAPHHDKGAINHVSKVLNLSLKDLRSNPLKITQFLFELSKENASKNTGNITQTEIMRSLGMSKDSARTAIRFLLKHKLLARIEFKSGKFGFSSYQLPESLFKELEYAYNKGSIAPLNIIIQKGFNSSNYINNTNTIIEPLSEWDNINISPLEHIGFTSKHLLQLKSKTSPEMAQESINHFAYALKFNPKTKKYDDPMSVLMGVLRKGEAWVEPSYRSPQELFQQELLERRRAEKLRIEKLQEDAYGLAFSDWKEKLSPEEIERIAPEKRVGQAIAPQQVRLSMYFRENIWSSIKSEYLIN